jgi:uncharacterized protein
MRRSLAATFAVVAVLACSPPALAAEAVSPAKLALARELIEVAGVIDFAANPEAIVEGMVEQLNRSSPGIDPEAVAAFRKIAREELDAYRPVMIEECIDIYTRHYSEDEIRGILAFYKSPVGRRMTAEAPAIARESSLKGAEFQGRIAKRFVAYMQERESKGKPAR